MEKENLISVDEMHILLGLAELMGKYNQKKNARNLLRQICKYAWEHYSDKEALLKIYPRAVARLMPLLISDCLFHEGMRLCRNAVELLCWKGVLFDLTELMAYYLICCEGNRSDQGKKYKKQLAAIKGVFIEYGIEDQAYNNSALYYNNQEIYLVDEVIKKGRIVHSMSQEALSENICTPETLSRIEGGRRAPNVRNFRALMEKLDLQIDYYNMELDTSDFLILEKKRELDRALSMKKWPESHALLEELKDNLDMDNPRNQQVILASENDLHYMEKSIDKAFYLKECERLLNCENSGWKEESFWKQFLTRSKIESLNSIATVYFDNNKKQDAAFIWEHILVQLEQSKVNLIDRFIPCMLVIGNLSICYGEMGRLDKSLNMCEKGIRLCIDISCCFNRNTRDERTIACYLFRYRLTTT